VKSGCQPLSAADSLLKAYQEADSLRASKQACYSILL